MADVAVGTPPLGHVRITGGASTAEESLGEAGSLVARPAVGVAGVEARAAQAEAA